MKRIKEERFIYHSSAACCCRSIGSLLYQLLMQLDTEPWKKISLIRNIFDQNPGRKYLWSEISLIRNAFDQNIFDQKYLWSDPWKKIYLIRVWILLPTYLGQVLALRFQLAYGFEFKVIEKEDLRENTTHIGINMFHTDDKISAVMLQLPPPLTTSCENMQLSPSHIDNTFP